MIITAKFDLGNEVRLPEAVHKELYGIITAILIDRDGIQYRIRYFWESKPQDVYFYDYELTEEVK